MTRIAALVLVFGTVTLPLQASAFGVANAGVVHDVGAVEAWPAGLAVLPSSDTLMFGTMGTGDGWHWTLVVSRVAADGTIDWTHTGASRPWSAERVVGAPGDTAVVFGDDNADRNFPAYLARFDADGHELWNRPANLDSTVTTLAADASSIWVLDDDARISRFSLDGDVLWQQTLGALAGCAPVCGGYDTLALVTDADSGVVVLGSVSFTNSPPNTLLAKVSPEGTLLWQHAIEDVETPRLARSASGALAVFGRVHDSNALRVIVYSRDGSELWRRSIDTTSYTHADDVAFDDADNVYTLSDPVIVDTVDAFAADGTPRWSHSWDISPDGFSGTTLSVGTSSEPVTILASLEAGEAAHGIAPDGTTAFDTWFPQTAGFMFPLKRTADGAALGLDTFRATPPNMVLGKLDSDGTLAWSTLPGVSEVPTAIGADDVAFQSDGSTTLLAVGDLGSLKIPREPFLSHLDAGGTETWRVPLTGASPLFGVLRASGADTLVAFQMPDVHDQAYLQRRNSNGDVVWEAVIDGSVSDLAVMPDASSATLTYVDNGGELARYDADGARRWTAPLTFTPTLQGGIPAGPQIAPGRDDTLYVVGTDDNASPFVEKFDMHGASLWAKAYPGGTYSGRRRGIAEDENGTAFLAYDKTTYPQSTTHLARLGADGTEAWGIDFADESISTSGRSLVPSAGGGVLLATTYGVRRIDANGIAIWTYPFGCMYSCYPIAIEERIDGHVFALSSMAQTWDLQAGSRADYLVELDPNGAPVDAYTSHAPGPAIDLATALQIAGPDVLIAGGSLGNDSISRARVVRLKGGDAIFADGFDGAAR